MPRGSYDFQQQCKTAKPVTKTKCKDALYVRRAYKRYGTKLNPVVVLNGLDMTVPKGCIYGLLGASGCGKTTLLNCIVGRKKLNSGDIWVLGGKPGSIGSGVPGPRIGYMPQNIGLLGSFTILETFKYFGWICNMTTKEIKAKVEFFINLLLLPSADYKVENLSGGQQRRVSLAVALLHEPELLILDEPTVGVDPLIRIKIWSHLLKITSEGNTTVILTTHYIDETKEANLIGLMRGGYLLAEESPTNLIQQYNALNLEDVFLKLSIKQNVSTGRKASILKNATKSNDSLNLSDGITNDGVIDNESLKENSLPFSNILTEKKTSKVVIAPEPVEEIPRLELPHEYEIKINYKNYFPVIKLNHMKAVIWKNFLWMWRNLPMMLFIVGLPISQMTLFGLSIGLEPKNLSLAVVNNEIQLNETCYTPLGCKNAILSCYYFEFITKHFSLYVDYYDNEDEARHMVEKGKSWAVIVVRHNFSNAFRKRIELGTNVDMEDLLASSIEVYQDKSNAIIDNYLSANLRKGFMEFIKSYLLSCGSNPALGDIPIRINKPIYGGNQLNFRDFAVPGVLLTIIFFMAVALTAASVLQEYKEGILERSLINGITSFELLLSQTISNVVVIFFQTLLLICATFTLFDLEQEGSWFLLVTLSLLSGMFGISYGFIVTCICNTERTATFMALGSFLPILNLCGMCWPIESMNEYLKKIAVWLPITQSTESLRCIMARGWGITNPVVYSGFIATIVWTIVFITISVFVLNRKERSENY